MWIPTEKVIEVMDKLNEFNTTELRKWRSTLMPTPPTSFKTNDMLEFHQLCVDTYKIATYGEINPAIFSVVTFPFLYGVMYGDYGHGMIFFALGVTLCLFEENFKKNPAMKGLLVSRYFWLMMGFFSMYHGLIYNEFFAISNDWFGSCYDVNSYQPNADPPVEKIFYKDSDSDCVYAFGLDPSWSLSTNFLTYTNNIKEKLSVIIAYTHLNQGILLWALNCIYFNRWQQLLYVVITGFFIFLGLIGYMIILIYVKWWYPVDSYEEI